MQGIDTRSESKKLRGHLTGLGINKLLDLPGASGACADFRNPQIIQVTQTLRALNYLNCSDYPSRD